MGAESSITQGSFQEHIELLRLFLARRAEIVENIAALLNSLRKPEQMRDSARLAIQFEDCFFAVAGSHAQLRGQLEAAYRGGEFRPREVQGITNDLIQPAEMMLRGAYCWQQTHWPGRGGRVHYAHTLFNLYVLRCLQFLSLHVRGLVEVQSVLDELWRSSPGNQPAFVRDARWLIPLAQSLITDALAPYFEVAREVTDTLPESDVIEIQNAHVRMLGGHLASQIRYYSTKDGVAFDHPSVVLRTRNSNALDFALLVQGLVVLLQAYEDAVQRGEERRRFEMAGAICQGTSADPELFLYRHDLLGAYTMVEHVFIDAGGYTAAGERHVRLLKEYGALIDRLLPLLRDDFPRFRPQAGRCSPYGVIFGLPSHLIEHMALKAIQPEAERRFSLEDVFADGDEGGAKLAWVNGWRDLPHIDREVRRMYDYPQRFAEEVFARIEREPASRETGRLHIVAGDKLEASYLASTDKQVIDSCKAEPYEAVRMVSARREAHFLVSFETPGGWTALKRDVLTEVLGEGHDATIVAMPREAVEVLRLMCGDLVMTGAG